MLATFLKVSTSVQARPLASKISIKTGFYRVGKNYIFFVRTINQANLEVPLIYSTGKQSKIETITSKVMIVEDKEK